MKLLRWAALSAAFTSLALSSCSGETAKTAEPSPSPVPSISLTPHKVSTSSLVNGSRIQIDVTDPKLTHEECSALVDHYLGDAGQKGQVVVQKPGGEIWKGALLPYCVNNLDSEGTFFNDYYFRDAAPSSTAKATGTVLRKEQPLTLQQLKTTKQIFQKATVLEKQGRSMEKLRTAGTASGRKNCGNLMRQRQAAAKTLRKQAEALPPSRLQSALEVATIDLNPCVSCSESTAKRSCNSVRSSLKDAASAMKTKN